MRILNVIGLFVQVYVKIQLYYVAIVQNVSNKQFEY